MRTKILAVAAAICAACITTSVAQTVYSVNAVGYVNTTLVPGFNLISNPLNAEDNTVVALFSALPNLSKVYKFDAGTGTYAISTKAPFGWSDKTMTLVPGEGAFVYVPGTENVTVTFVGEVPQGTLTVQLPAGFSIASSIVPQEASLNDIGYPAVLGDKVYTYDNGYTTYTRSFGSNWTPGAPVIKVGEAFFAYKATEAAEWTREFSVNQ